MASIDLDTRTADTRTVSELFRELAGETATLVKKEVELARVELGKKTEEAKLAAFQALAGLALFFSGALIMLLGVTWGLGQSIPLWLAGLIVGLVAAGVGAWMLKEVEKMPPKILRKTAKTVEKELS